MGGFELRGPIHTFHSINPPNCRCPMYRADIDESTESKLLNKRVHRLYVTRDLSEALRDQIKTERPHLGTDRMYHVERNDFDPQKDAEIKVLMSANAVLQSLHESLHNVA